MRSRSIVAAVLAILIYVIIRPWLMGHEYFKTEMTARVLRDIGIWGTVIITCYSGLHYVRQAVRMYRKTTVDGSNP